MAGCYPIEIRALSGVAQRQIENALKIIKVVSFAITT
jgi:hypothetical protein